MPGKDAEDYILQRPLAAVIVQYVLVVLHILWKVLELHQHLLLLIILIIPTLLLLSTTTALPLLPRPRLGFFPVIAHLAGKHLVLRQIWTVRLRTSSLSLPRNSSLVVFLLVTIYMRPPQRVGLFF